MNVVLLLVLTGLVMALRSFSTANDVVVTGTTLAFGYLLLSAFFVGGFFRAVNLPRLTGYLVTGVVVGPAVLDLVSQPMIGSLQIVNGMAVGLIAMSAGSELELNETKPLVRSIGWIIGLAVVLAVLLLTVVLLIAQRWLPFLAELDWSTKVAVAVMLAVVMAAQSPAVVIALRDELQASGPVSRTALGIVVVGDLVIIVMFAITSAVAKAALGTGGSVLETLAMVCWELFGSIGFGAAIGFVLAQFLQRVEGSAALFVMLVAFVIAEVGQRLALDPLLLALSAGLVVRNFSGQGKKLYAVISGAGVPVYVLFFAVAGASLKLHALIAVGLFAPILALARATGLLSGGKMGAKLAAADPSVQRFTPYGLLPQSGLALALSNLMIRSFPALGEEAGALTLGVVALNELVAPVVYRWALVKSGEGNPAATPVASAH